MNNKIFTFGKKIQEWLEQFAPTYRGVLPNSQKPADLYLRHDGYFDNFSTRFIYPVQIYKINTTSYASVVLLADQIERAIGDGGITIRDNEMVIHIEKGSPFYQDKPDEDETVRAGYINLDISIYAVTATIKYRVAFIDYLNDTEDDSTIWGKPKWYAKDETITLPNNDYQKLGYFFYGWNDGEKAYHADTEYVIPARNVDFIAEWHELIIYTITFIADGVTVDTREYDYLHKDIMTPAVPNKPNYIGRWENFDLEDKEEDFDINAIYTDRPDKLYSGTFKAGSKLNLRRV